MKLWFKKVYFLWTCLPNQGHNHQNNIYILCTPIRKEGRKKERIKKIVRRKIEKNEGKERKGSFYLHKAYCWRKDKNNRHIGNTFRCISGSSVLYERNSHIRP